MLITKLFHTIRNKYKKLNSNLGFLRIDNNKNTGKNILYDSFGKFKVFRNSK